MFDIFKKMGLKLYTQLTKVAIIQSENIKLLCYSFLNIHRTFSETPGIVQKVLIMSTVEKTS